MTNSIEGAMPPLPERNRLMTLTAPRAIWLNVFTGDPDGEFPADHEGITWCEDEAGDVDVPYVRADIHSHLIARVAELQADAAELAFLAEDLLYWVDRAVSKGNANSDIEEAYERYEQWQRARAALAANKEQQP